MSVSLPPKGHSHAMQFRPRVEWKEKIDKDIDTMVDKALGACDKRFAPANGFRKHLRAVVVEKRQEMALADENVMFSGLSRTQEGIFIHEVLKTAKETFKPAHSMKVRPEQHGCAAQDLVGRDIAAIKSGIRYGPVCTADQADTMFKVKILSAEYKNADLAGKREILTNLGLSISDMNLCRQVSDKIGGLDDSAGHNSLEASFEELERARQSQPCGNDPAMSILYRKLEMLLDRLPETRETVKKLIDSATSLLTDTDIQKVSAEDRAFVMRLCIAKACSDSQPAAGRRPAGGHRIAGQDPSDIENSGDHESSAYSQTSHSTSHSTFSEYTSAAVYHSASQSGDWSDDEWEEHFYVPPTPPNSRKDEWTGDALSSESHNQNASRHVRAQHDRNVGPINGHDHGRAIDGRRGEPKAFRARDENAHRSPVDKAQKTVVDEISRRFSDDTALRDELKKAFRQCESRIESDATKLQLFKWLQDPSLSNWELRDRIVRLEQAVEHSRFYGSTQESIDAEIVTLTST